MVDAATNISPVVMPGSIRISALDDALKIEGQNEKVQGIFEVAFSAFPEEGIDFLRTFVTKDKVLPFLSRGSALKKADESSRESHSLIASAREKAMGPIHDALGALTFFKDGNERYGQTCNALYPTDTPSPSLETEFKRDLAYHILKAHLKAFDSPQPSKDRETILSAMVETGVNLDRYEACSLITGLGRHVIDSQKKLLWFEDFAARNPEAMKTELVKSSAVKFLEECFTSIAPTEVRKGILEWLSKIDSPETINVLGDLLDKQRFNSEELGLFNRVVSSATKYDPGRALMIASNEYHYPTTKDSAAEAIQMVGDTILCNVTWGDKSILVKSVKAALNEDGYGWRFIKKHKIAKAIRDNGDVNSVRDLTKIAIEFMEKGKRTMGQDVLHAARIITEKERAKAALR